MALTDETKIENYLGRDLNSREQTLLSDSLLAAVDRYIADYTGKDYGSDDTDSARYYDGNGGKWLFIDPINSVTSIQYVDYEDNEDAELDDDGTEYVLYPLNSAPYTSLYRRNARWGYGHKNIKITGDWTTAAPATITLAATMLAAGYLGSAEGTLKSESIEGYSRVFADVSADNIEIMNLLDAERGILL